MRVVSIVNQKGGVAKTTTCANLGACLAGRGQRTLLVDLDPQANLTLGFRRAWGEPRYGLSDVLLNPESFPLSGVIRQVGAAPLYVAPGHMQLARCEPALARKADGVYNLSRALSRLADLHRLDWVLIDCPPSLGMLTQSAIVAATHLLIPTEPKFYAFAGMDTLNRLVTALTRDLEFELRLLGVLLTLYEPRTNLHRTIAAGIRERFGDRVFETVIPRNIRLSEAELEGEPVTTFDHRARASEAYETLAGEVLRRAAAEAQILQRQRYTTSASI